MLVARIHAYMAHNIQRRPARRDVESQQEPLLLNSNESNHTVESVSDSRSLPVADVARNIIQNQKQPDSFRNVEDSVERPMRGTSYNEATPWHQDDNLPKRYPAIVAKRVWQLLEEVAFRTPDGVRVVTAPFLMIMGAALFVGGCIPVLVVHTLHYLFEGVVRVAYAPVIFPLPFWVIACLLTNVFLCLALVTGDFPLVPLIAEGFW